MFNRKNKWSAHVMIREGPYFMNDAKWSIHIVDKSTEKNGSLYKKISILRLLVLSIFELEFI